MDEDRPIDRRRFFREGLRGLLRPISTAVRPLENIAHQIGKLDPPIPARFASEPPKPPADKKWLRPPGALDEPQFAKTCSKCGECVRVCPVQCIAIDPTATLGGGVPYIDASTQACVMCEELACMQHCPSGALLPVPRQLIDMGTAIVNDKICLRTNGEQCTLCVDHCPVGSAALVIAEGKVKVLEAGCTGCGQCQNECPTEPKSIVVEPRGKKLAVL